MSREGKALDFKESFMSKALLNLPLFLVENEPGLTRNFKAICELNARFDPAQKSPPPSPTHRSRFRYFAEDFDSSDLVGSAKAIQSLDHASDLQIKGDVSALPREFVPNPPDKKPLRRIISWEGATELKRSVPRVQNNRPRSHSLSASFRSRAL